ncbi:MAG TPA: Tad domain-containing protein [Candidatus Limnocylindria bacterium]
MKAFFGPQGTGGQAVVMVAIVFMALMFAVGLAIDAGQLYAAKRTMQEAADAGAFAGAVVLYQGGSVLDATTAALADTTKNGFTDGQLSTTVRVNGSARACDACSPTSGQYASETPIKHVEVVITRQVRTTLVPAESQLTLVVARGEGGAEPLNSGYAIIQLDTSCTPGSLYVQNNVDIHLTGGGLMVNSCSSTSVTGVSPTTDLTICATPPAPCTPNPYSVDLVGGAAVTWPASIAVHTGVPIQPDPFAGTPKPSNLKSYDGIHDLPLNPGPVSGTTNTYPEGIYRNQIDGNPGNFYVCHGIYILQNGMGGDIYRDTNPAHIDTNTMTPCDGKVLIFNTTTTFPAAGGTCGGIGVGTNGNHPITLRPMDSIPATGQQAYVNFTIFQDPSCTATMDVGGNQVLDVGGTIYIPNALLKMEGNPSTIDGGQFVAKTLQIQNGNLNINYSAGVTAQPIQPRLSR